MRKIKISLSPHYFKECEFVRMRLSVELNVILPILEQNFKTLSFEECYRQVYIFTEKYKIRATKSIKEMVETHVDNLNFENIQIIFDICLYPFRHYPKFEIQMRDFFYKRLYERFIKREISPIYGIDKLIIKKIVGYIEITQKMKVLKIKNNKH